MDSLEQLYTELVRDGLIKEINYLDKNLSNYDIQRLRRFEELIKDADNQKEYFESEKEDYEDQIQDLEDRVDELEERLERLED